MTERTAVTETASAKINLFLEVKGIRKDGYHEMETVMQSVSLSDTLRVKRRETAGILLHADEGVPTDGNNLVCRAAEAFFAYTKAPFGVEATLEKRIPVAAGMGGGSADAAAMLRALNRLSGEKLSLDILEKIGGTVGADVPFCIRGGARICRGIGDVTEPITNRLTGTLVTAVLGEGVSTPAAFRAMDEREHRFGKEHKPLSAAPLLAALKIGDEEGVAAAAFNRFEAAILPLRPAVGKLKQILKEEGAFLAQMSGSGPSVFGIFQREENAISAVTVLKKAGAKAFLCHMHTD